MSILKVNTYLTDRNITNMALNVDYDRLGEDKIDISINNATTPATITIKNGSIIECNGNRYLIDADYSFQMSNANHNYLTFTDNPAIAFSSVATIGIFDVEKQGYYQIGNLIRTLKYYIDQVGGSIVELIDELYGNKQITTKLYERFRIYVNSVSAPPGKMHLDSVDYDELSSWDTINYEFECQNDGMFIFILSYYGSGGVAIRKNTTAISTIYNYGATSDYQCAIIDHLIKGDVIDVYITGSTPGDLSKTRTYLCGERLA